jgi:CubicO group peptidase (beta-lactamase class C family)
MCSRHLRVVRRSTGDHASPNTFGHGGSQSSVGFCDPERKVTALIFCNTRPGPKHHYERLAAISTALFEDLGFRKQDAAAASKDAS